LSGGSLYALKRAEEAALVASQLPVLKTYTAVCHLIHAKYQLSWELPALLSTNAAISLFAALESA
jgi:uncharacterized protein GlcG (DUF336 family)